MNAEQFYEELKVILDQLGIGWFGKDQAQVSGHLTFIVEDGGKKTVIELKVGDGE